MRRLRRALITLAVAGVLALGLAGPAVGARGPGELGSGGQRDAGPSPVPGHDDVHRAARPDAVDRPRAGRQRHAGRIGTRKTVPGQEDQLRIALPADLPDGVYTVNWRVVSEADGHATAGAFSFGVNVAPGTVVIPERPRRRRRPHRPWRASRASCSSTWGSRCRSRPRSSGCARSGATILRPEVGAAVRSRGGRGRRRHDAPVRARHARRVDGRPAVVGDGHGLPLAARRRDVRRGRGAGRRTTVRPDVARRRRGRRGGGHAHPCHRRSRRRRGDPGAPDRPAVAPLHGRERLDGRPRAHVRVAPRAAPSRGRGPGRRGPARTRPWPATRWSSCSSPACCARRRRSGACRTCCDLFRGSYGTTLDIKVAVVLRPDRAGCVQPVPFDPADGARAPGLLPPRHGDRAGGGRWASSALTGTLTGLSPRPPVTPPAPTPPARHAHRQRLRDDHEGHRSS